MKSNEIIWKHVFRFAHTNQFHIHRCHIASSDFSSFVCWKRLFNLQHLLLYWLVFTFFSHPWCTHSTTLLVNCSFMFHIKPIYPEAFSISYCSSIWVIHAASLSFYWFHSNRQFGLFAISILYLLDMCSCDLTIFCFLYFLVSTKMQIFDRFNRLKTILSKYSTILTSCTYLGAHFFFLIQKPLVTLFAVVQWMKKKGLILSPRKWK